MLDLDTPSPHAARWSRRAWTLAFVAGVAAGFVIEGATAFALVHSGRSVRFQLDYTGDRATAKLITSTEALAVPGRGAGANTDLRAIVVDVVTDLGHSGAGPTPDPTCRIVVNGIVVDQERGRDGEALCTWANRW